MDEAGRPSGVECPKHEVFVVRCGYRTLAPRPTQGVGHLLHTAAYGPPRAPLATLDNFKHTPFSRSTQTSAQACWTMEQAPVQIGQFILGKNLGIGAFGKVRNNHGTLPRAKSLTSQDPVAVLRAISDTLLPTFVCQIVHDVMDMTLTLLLLFFLSW